MPQDAVGKQQAQQAQADARRAKENAKREEDKAQDAKREATDHLALLELTLLLLVGSEGRKGSRACKEKSEFTCTSRF